MKAINFLLCFFVVFIISLGQVLYKLASSKIDMDHNKWIFSLIFNSHFIIAILLYVLASGLWVLAIKNMPLSIIYPITALAYFFVPLLSYFFLGENLKISTFIGAFLIAFGVYISSLQNA